MLPAQELAPAALCPRSCRQFTGEVPVGAKHSLPGAFSGTQEASGPRARHILSHLERGLEDKNPFVTHSGQGRNALTVPLSLL